MFRATITKRFLRSHLGEDEFHRGGIYDRRRETSSANMAASSCSRSASARVARRFAAAALRYRSRSGDESRHRRRREDLILRGIRDRSCELASRCRASPTREPLEVTVKIRYSHPGTRATLTPLENERARVRVARAANGGHARAGRSLLRRGCCARWRLDLPAARPWSRPDKWLGNSARAAARFPRCETARRIANQLVTGNLAACANIFPAVESIYRWKEKIESGNETLVLFKMSDDRQSSVSGETALLHPYEVPEIIFVPISSGLPEYLRWVTENCG